MMGIVLTRIKFDKIYVTHTHTQTIWMYGVSINYCPEGDFLEEKQSHRGILNYVGGTSRYNSLLRSLIFFGGV